MPSSSFGTNWRCTPSSAPGGVFDLELVEEQQSMVVLVISGKGAEHAFRNEGGGHRYQRIPPTERKGRVQTSTVTVAVLPVPEEHECRLDDKDLDWKTCRAGGSGGQHVNKTESAVQLTHKPTGLMVRCESERSQLQNRATALALLRARLGEQQVGARQASRNQDRKEQVGTGMRGDKVRTIALQRDQVHDHITDKRMPVKQYLRGELELLW